MRPLASQEVLDLWEVGASQHPLDRALTILATARPDLSWDELADLSLGRLEALLLRLHATAFGPGLLAYAECPACGERLEFALDADELLAAESVATGSEHELPIDDLELRFRLPTSRDLAAAVALGDPAAGRRELVRRCVREARRAEATIEPDDLPSEVVAQLAEQVARAEPLVETLVDLRCPGCDQAWQEQLDVGAFLWTELSGLARRLLWEVHALARAYGWREADILALSPRRRQSYLELVGA